MRKMSDNEFTVTLDLKHDYQIWADFGMPGVEPLLLDEPSPLGDDHGPNAARVLAAAIGNCLTASALFCLRKARVEVLDMHTTVNVKLERNERGKLRVGNVKVNLEPTVAEEDRPRMKRCLDIFEDYCIVTQSVRSGLNVDVAVEPETVTVAA
jgi:uncharacterized OsmC-like protein